MRVNSLPEKIPDDILWHIHFRAYRFLQRDGYTPDDIAGFVEVAQEELIKRHPDYVEYLTEKGRWYAAEYFFKPNAKNPEVKP